MSTPSMATLAGRLLVTPGAPLPNSLGSSRQDWASRVGAGQPVATLPGLLASLFNLCGNAHRACAQLAIGAADATEAGQSAPDDISERLRLETAQEHIRRIGLDWPRLLTRGADHTACAQAAADTLACCPALRPPGQALWPALHDWLQHHWLQMDPATWLSAWCAGAGDWLHAWAQRHSGWLPSLLREAQQADMPNHPLNSRRALTVHGASASLRRLSDALSGTPGFVQQPDWQGTVAHSGAWARLQTPAEQPALSPWAMLGSRIAELVRLCLPGAAPDHGALWLRWGALHVQPGTGLGWVEMARGLLVHQVTLNDGGRSAQSCRVLAPTEWNFHPQGEVAQRLSALDPASPGLRQQVAVLMAAFDPCVPYELAPNPAQEADHA